MTTFPVGNPYPIILGLDGVGLDGGSAYIGLVNQDPISFPQAVYWDAALTIPASQPLQIDAGYFYYLGSPAAPYVGARYSITVLDAQGVLVFTNLAVGSALASGPTIQKFLSGTGTYTTPSGVTWIEVTMSGGGGGGGGSSTGGQTGGGTGGNTTFGTTLLIANGGAGGSAATGVVGPGGAGGSFSLGSAIGFGVAGGNGSTGIGTSPTSAALLGGAGGVNPLGGSSGGNASVGGSGVSNTGAGGRGGGQGLAGSVSNTGGGGGAGGFLNAYINNPAASYSYSVGAAGTAGAGTQPGGLGGSGVIIVTEHYAS